MRHEEFEIHKIIRAIKSALKKRSLTYKQLAEHLDISEPSVKRMLGGSGSLTLERVKAISEWLGMSMFELFRLAEGCPGILSSAATSECEHYLANNPRAFAFLYKLGCNIEPKKIIHEFKIPESEAREILRKFEDFGLLQLMPHDRVRLTFGDFLRFDKDGPVNKKYFKMRYEHVETHLKSVMPVDHERTAKEKERFETLISFYLPKQRYMKFIEELEEFNQQLIEKYTDIHEEFEDGVPITLLTYADQIDMWKPIERFLSA